MEYLTARIWNTEEPPYSFRTDFSTTSNKYTLIKQPINSFYKNLSSKLKQFIHIYSSKS